VWSLTLDKTALAVHLAIDGSDTDINSQDVLREANRLLKKKYKIAHATIQIEFYQPSIMANCRQCQPPKK